MLTDEMIEAGRKEAERFFGPSGDEPELEADALSAIYLAMHEARPPLSDDKLSGLVERLRDNIITLWHDSKSEDRALHECLGMTWEEYQSWVSGKALSTTEGSDR